MSEIQALGKSIENARLAWRYACEMAQTPRNTAIADEALARLDSDIEKLTLLHSDDQADWAVKACVLITCGDNHLDSELSLLAMSLAQDVAFPDLVRRSRIGAEYIISPSSAAFA